MEKTVLNVQGMSCDHCKKAVTGAVSAVTGVAGVEVDLAAKTVTVEHETGKCDLNAVKAAIVEEGFEVCA